MGESIKLYRGEFGHVSILNVARDFVTHAHAEAQMLIWLDGSAGEMTIGRDSAVLGADTVACINPLEPHSHTLSNCGTPGLFLNFYVDMEWVRRRAGLTRRDVLFGRPFTPLSPMLRGVAGEILVGLDEGQSDDDLVAYEIERFIDGVIEASVADAPAAQAHAALDFRVRKAIELMRSNVGDKICLDAVARSVGLSRPHFFALFREQMHVTPNVYWNSLRMDEALRQLRLPDESLVSVACSLGFSSQGNFTRFFRDRAGVPPTVYRSAVMQAA